MSKTLLFRAASITVLIAIWVLSFLPASGLPSVPGNDKWHHALAYFTCMFFWAQWITPPRLRLKLALAFIFMGALIECLQGLTPHRAFEWLDMLANTAGVIVAWFVVTVQLALQRRLSGSKASLPRS